MIKKTIHSVLPFMIFFLFVFAASKTNKMESTFGLLTTQKTFIAGNPITVNFSTTAKDAEATLFLIHSYGKTLLYSRSNLGKISFGIPSIYCQKTGHVSWILIRKNKKIAKGDFVITANNSTKTRLESYLGPPSVLTGTAYYTMMVTIPTDTLDNPKDDNTTVLIKNQFQENIATVTKKTKSFIAWDNIYSRTKSGKLLISTECENTDSKEFEAEILPNIGTDFSIIYARNHKYADGNQITKIISSEIKDQYGNLVCDGTLVAFQVLTKNNLVLKTYAATINGVAIGQILHPDHEETFTITGYITGIAKSKSIQIYYSPLLKDFPYSFSEKNRKIRVGPIKSFMKQLVPDGIKIELKIYLKNKLIETKIVESSKGIATFYLLPPFYKAKEYQFEITTLGVTRRTEIKKYENN